MSHYHARLTTEEWMKFLKDFHTLEVERVTQIEIIPDLVQGDPQYDGKSLVILTTPETYEESLDTYFTNGHLHNCGWDKKFKKL